ncbi:hypothetical protein B8W69_11845 [Mycobacterium vulneris]|uniref:NmrA-like domain-containing protein n=1 Tax=Mycolicibacterium vulneris TaxID=547163 RepID=A0A1X2L3I8_9MYCO|nr:NmrA family NAD(P)-binding protein [Mycolicibacterium vulneris]OSC28485.1 hypothetical protein B8W69_11845 [Mycolicibacterium vulneris]
MSEIVLIGAAGAAGLRLVRALNTARANYRVVSHSEVGTTRLVEAGAPAPIVANLGQPSTLASAMANASVVYAIPPALHPREDQYLINAIHAAEAAGVERFVYHSVLHANTPFLRNHQRKASVEAVLRASSLSWTILQPSMYAQVALALFGSTQGNTVRIPFDIDADISIIDLDDWAAVALRTLLELGAHDYASYELAGPAVTMRRAVEALGRACGKDLQACTVPVASGPLPPRAAEDPRAAADMISTYAHYDRHGFRGNPFVLTQLLGRPPATIEDVVAREYGPPVNTP